MYVCLSVLQEGQRAELYFDSKLIFFSFFSSELGSDQELNGCIFIWQGYMSNPYRRYACS